MPSEQSQSRVYHAWRWWHDSMLKIGYSTWMHVAGGALVQAFAAIFALMGEPLWSVLLFSAIGWFSIATGYYNYRTGAEYDAR